VRRYRQLGLWRGLGKTNKNMSKGGFQRMDALISKRAGRQVGTD